MANTPHNEIHAMMITRELTPDGERYTLSLCQLHAAVLTDAATLAGLAPDRFVLRAIGNAIADAAEHAGHHPDATQPPETVN